jgi:release factor glutamine methyltransferase
VKKMPPETAGALLRRGGDRLVQAGIAGGRRDARLLLQYAAGLSQTDLVAEPDRMMAEHDAALFDRFVARRIRGEPVSRIAGEREFYGRCFDVAPDVLDPRADTETLIDAVLPFARALGECRILDAGTGSGAIIVTLLAQLPLASGVATDLSEAALAVARRNAVRHQVDDRLELLQTDWASGCAGPFDLVVSNPPYIPAADIAGLDAEVREHDPLLALSGGQDGLDAYRALLPQAAGLVSPHGRVAVEFGAGQHDGVAAIARAAGLQTAAKACGLFKDLSGHIRCAMFARS